MGLNAQRILVCVSGGIAAYKSAELVRRLIERGAEVRVAMTASACEFITPLTLQAVSQNPVHTHLLDPQAEMGMGHIELAKWAELIVIAPASANCIARLAHGFADDLITSVCLATTARCAVAPAMNQQMYAQEATQENLATLKRRGVLIWGPASGQQACGDVGLGRMLEPNTLVQHCLDFFAPKSLSGMSVVITAGPTYEAIDPVRFIGNHSSGKMGFALAQAAAARGAQVTLIAGPSALPTPAQVQRINVVSAQEMHTAVFEHVNTNTLFIGCAAVADYRPDTQHTQKLKKSSEELALRLVPNPDIISEVAATKQAAFCVGFAAETHKVAFHAQEKRERKQLDLIIANHVGQEGSGFNADDNAVTLYGPTSEQVFPKTPKLILAYQLIDEIVKCYREHEKTN